MIRSLEEPLINNQGKTFQAFFPTPNYATIKRLHPWQKAINYKGHRILKDLFKTRDKENKMKQMTSRKKESLKQKKIKNKEK